MQEHHLKEGFSWPDGSRLAVFLSFDFQGAEGIQPLKDGRIDHEACTQAEYGPKTGIWRILKILDQRKVKATFLTCGAIAEKYPSLFVPSLPAAMKSPVMDITTRWPAIYHERRSRPSLSG